MVITAATLRSRRVRASPVLPRRPFVRRARGVSTSSVATTWAGRGESRKILSASAIASERSWVTISVVMCFSSISAAIFSRRFSRKRGVERDERFVEQQQIGLHRKRARERHASREAQRQFAGKMRGVLGEARAPTSSAAISSSCACGAAMRRLSATLRQGRRRGS